MIGRCKKEAMREACRQSFSLGRYSGARVAQSLLAYTMAGAPLRVAVEAIGEIAGLREIYS